MLLFAFQIQETVRRAEEQSGCVDLLINNAGFVVQGGFDEIPVESFLEQMKINYLGGVSLKASKYSSPFLSGPSHPSRDHRDEETRMWTRLFCELSSRAMRDLGI